MTLAATFRAATISACGRYRYDLVRGEGEPSICWVMLNPSTADAHRDDPTIRRVIGFSRRWGFASAVVVNLFAWRATRPEDLLAVADPVGPENDAAVRNAVGRSRVAMLAHGALPGAFARRAEAVGALVQTARPEVLCLGHTASGWPRHPLYVRGDAEPRPLDPVRGGHSAARSSAIIGNRQRAGVAQLVER